MATYALMQVIASRIYTTCPVDGAQMLHIQRIQLLGDVEGLRDVIRTELF